MSAENIYSFYKDTLKAGDGWSLKRAKAILRAWQRRFLERVHEWDGANDNGNDKLYAFNEATLNDVIAEFSEISSVKLLGGYVLMVSARVKVIDFALLRAFQLTLEEVLPPRCSGSSLELSAREYTS